ncbi:MAG: cache domain-containing protein, partial [Deltaproteobacteria bacterium]|nr:cache domain-containing protein [Deltaproteobacteria bacterium]
MKKLLDMLFGTEREEHRIGLLTGGILVFITLVTSAMVFYIVAGQLGQEFEKGIVRTLNDREKLFHAELDHGMAITQNAAMQPHLVNLMRAQEKDIQTLGMEIEGMLISNGLSGVSLQDASGKVLATRGNFVPAPGMVAELAHPYRATLLWKGQYFLHTRVDIRNGGQLLGLLDMEMALSDITALVNDFQGLGETGEMVVCAPRGSDRLRCFPSRHRQTPFELPRMLNNKPLPLSLALDGKSGYRVTKDYREAEVFDAYKPLGDTGLGMVVKIDTAELERPIRRHLLAGVGVLALLVILGTWLLRWQVGPL